MRRISKFAVVALVGAAIGAVVARFRRAEGTPEAPPDQRTEELRRKLAEARAAAADQDDFEAAGMGAETIVEEPPRAEPAREEAAPAEEPPPAEAEAAAEPEPPTPSPEAEAAAEPEPPTPSPEAEAAAEPEPATPSPEAEPAPPAEAEPPPQDEFEAMRRRIHEEGKAAAEEMRRSADPPDQS